MSGFDGESFRTLWKSLSPRVQQRIRDKAAWENMSVSAVIRDWWPHLWRKVKKL